MIEGFKAFNIKTILRRHNMVANSLAVAASTFQPVEGSKLKKFEIRTYRCSMTIDISKTSWQAKGSSHPNRLKRKEKSSQSRRNSFHYMMSMLMDSSSSRPTNCRKG